MDVDIKDPSPRINRVLNRKLRLRNASKTKQDINAMESLRNITYGAIDRVFIRYIDFLEDNFPILFFVQAVKMRHGSFPASFVNVQDS